MSTELEDRLRASLRDVPAGVPPGLALTAYQRYRRRRLVTGAGVAATAAVTAAAVVLTAAASPAPSQPATTGYLVSRVTTALAAISPDVILYDHWTLSGPRSRTEQSWATTTQWRIEFAEAGRELVTAGATKTSASSAQLVYVDYQRRDWWRTTATPVEFTRPECNGISVTASATATVDAIRAALSCGELKMSGPGYVDGVHALQLTGTRPNGPRITVWIDPVTYLPVRLTLSGPSRQVLYQDDYRWLPPTPANRAELSVSIPPGFTRIPRTSAQGYVAPPW